MKKLFTILTVVAISTTMTFAQQGTVAIGVGSNLANVSWQDYALVPTVGYFLNDNMMVGTGFMSMTTTEEVLDGSGLYSTEYKDGGMSLSPFVRYYMGETLFISAGMAINSTSSTSEWSYLTESFESEERTTETGIAVGVGYSLMWGEHICFEPSFSVVTLGGSQETESTYRDATTSTTVKDDSDAPSTFGMAIGLGVNIRLGGE